MVNGRGKNNKLTKRFGRGRVVTLWELLNCKLVEPWRSHIGFHQDNRCSRALFSVGFLCKPERINRDFHRSHSAIHGPALLRDTTIPAVHLPQKTWNFDDLVNVVAEEI